MIKVTTMDYHNLKADQAKEEEKAKKEVNEKDEKIKDLKKNIESISHILSRMFIIYLTLFIYSVVKSLSISDLSLIIKNSEIALPVVNISLTIPLFFTLSQFILLSIYLYFQFYYNRLIELKRKIIEIGGDLSTIHPWFFNITSEVKKGLIKNFQVIITKFILWISLPLASIIISSKYVKTHDELSNYIIWFPIIISVIVIFLWFYIDYLKRFSILSHQYFFVEKVYEESKDNKPLKNLFLPYEESKIILNDDLNELRNKVLFEEFVNCKAPNFFNKFLHFILKKQKIKFSKKLNYLTNILLFIRFNFGKIIFVIFLLLQLTHFHSFQKNGIIGVEDKLFGFFKPLEIANTIDLSNLTVVQDPKIEGQDYWLNLKGCHLEGANLSNAYLKKVDFRGAFLNKTIFIGAFLEGSNFERTDLSIVKSLAGANLKNANLTKANLKKTEFMSANLENANLSETNLEETNFTLTNLSNVNFYKTTFVKTKLDRAYIINSNFSYTKINNVELTHTLLTGSNFTNSIIENSIIANSFAEGTYFYSANIINTTFDNCYLEASRFFKASLKNVNFKNCYLDFVDFYETNISDDTNFLKARFSKINHSKQNIFRNVESLGYDKWNINWIIKLKKLATDFEEDREGLQKIFKTDLIYKEISGSVNLNV